MGTSLSGLTPATTFDGLLKVGDNDPLTATLKPISTGDGTDTILDLSTTAFKVSGETIVEGATTGEFFKVRNASNPTQEFYIEKVDDALNRFNAGTDTTYITYRDGAHLRFVVGGTTHAQLANTGDLSIGLGGSNASARMHIKGSGATSATTSLLVQNSAGSELFKVQDDGRVDFASLFALGTNIYGTNSSFRINIASSNEYSTFDGHIFKTYDGTAYSEAMRITGNTSQFVGIGETTPTARLHVKGSGNTNTTTSLLVQNSDGADAFKIDDSRAIDATSTAFRVRKASNNSQALFVGETYTASAQKTIINSLQGPSAIFQVVGSGATSATFTLKAQNSGGETMFSIRDDKTIQIDGSRFTFNSSAFTSYADILLNTDLAVGTTTIAANTRAHIKGSGNTATTTALLVQNSDAADILKVTDDGTTQFISKDASASLLQITTGNTYNGFKFVGNGYSKEWRTYSTGTWFADSMALSSGFLLPTAKLQVKGTGSTSATTALLVQNSAGTGFFKYRDDGLIQAKNPATNTSTFFQLLNGNGNSLFKVLANGTILAENLPTSAAGLPAGAIYNDAGTLKIV